ARRGGSFGAPVSPPVGGDRGRCAGARFRRRGGGREDARLVAGWGRCFGWVFGGCSAGRCSSCRGGRGGSGFASRARGSGTASCGWRRQVCACACGCEEGRQE